MEPPGEVQGFKRRTVGCEPSQDPPSRRGATHGFGGAEDFFILYGTLTPPFANVRADAFTDDVAGAPVWSGTTGANPELARGEQPVESVSIEPGIGRALELADGAGATQRHGGADPVAQIGGTGMDSFAATPQEVADSFRSSPRRQRVGLGGKPGGMRLGSGGSPATARSQPAGSTTMAR